MHQYQCTIRGQGRQRVEQRQLGGGAGERFDAVHAADMQDNPACIAGTEPRDIDAQRFMVGAAGGDGQCFDSGIMTQGGCAKP